jgi:fatty-acyl-CoA synthase
MRNEGLGSWPVRRARMSPKRVAFEGLSYADVARESAGAAQALRDLGVRRGDRVAYLGPNHPHFVRALFGTAQLGAIFVPLNTRLAEPELRFILDDCGAKVLVTDRAEALAPVQVKTGDLRAEASYVDEAVAEHDDCLILYTSGTTGRPKGARLTHANLAWNTFNLLIDVDLASDEVTLVSAPMFHVAALNQTVLPTFLKGGRSILVPAFDPDETLDLIERHGVTYMFGVPSMFQAIANAPRFGTADLSSVRSMICGGAPVPAPLIEVYRRRGLTFMEGYGMTETSPGALFLRKYDTGHAGSAGTPVFFGDVRLRSLDGGEYGEIEVHGPNVMAGYWQRPEDTAAVIDDEGWFRSGDLATVDDDGFFHVRDRLKDMYISGGENVYPAEVEEQLYAHPSVAECAVVGVPDERWGEVGRAFVVAKSPVDEADLLRFLDGRLARYKLPKHVEFVESLPRTGSGKVLKSRLR